MYSKHKDATPEQTIEKIQGILQELELQPEVRLLQNTDHIYSSSLIDREHGWSVNGKGTSEAYCMASAYGEAMERLQAYFIYDNLNNQSAEKGDAFRLYPDEKLTDIRSCKADYPVIYEELRRSYAMEKKCAPEEITDEELNAFLPGYFTDAAIGVPYYGLDEQKLVYLPEQMVSSLCGSNGLAAGNTPYEALNQGIAEILERHVKGIIFEKGYTPPEVPRAYLQEKMPELYDMIVQIESMGPYHIIIKDASLGIGMPVIGALFVDYEKQRYHSKFGASFSMYIAIERCLTELCQGFDLQNPSCHERLMTSWDVAHSSDWGNAANRSVQLRSDTGSVPVSFMGGQPSWEFQDWEVSEGYGRSTFDNRQALAFMIDRLRYFEPHIYIRSYSFLGFPTYRIFVPGLSVTHLPLGPDRRKYKREQESIKQLKSIPAVRMEPERLRECFDFLTAEDNLLQDSFDDIPTEVVRAVFYYYYDQMDKAIAALRSLSEGNDSQKYSCAAMELELQKLGLDAASRDRLLLLFFEERYTKLARRAFRKIEGRESHTYLIDRIIDPLGKKLFYMGAGPNAASRARMHTLMRRKMRENMPDQTEVMQLIQDLISSNAC